MEIERKDKEVYNYKQALEQPIWIQKITDTFSLKNAIRLSTIIWSICVAITLLLLVSLVSRFTFIPFPFLATLAVMASWTLGMLLSELKIEEKTVLRFTFDYLKFYLVYGRKAKTHYLNKGFLYKKK
ncbi:conjugal transfer protein [Streptococcus mutans]|uniref:conjugal transfer protein n=1 Tax=Streptococcus mutans TaxID=1309 RepID=UPI0002B54310|nr:conjugal transfer protein [Streptococcus mutans]ARS61672.1 conjugal transfer protein [Streptococcus mutans]EMB84076.1 hypothetical protein SMU54_07782 [Streptococcus mutans A9]EMC53076.1 hypothetical protein SMU105_08768 [Streptococcus mutans SF12]ESS18336.1 hypothetical protein PLG01_00174 [Streptococcus mutans PKUSS-LG01]ESS18690.1 hypothetical protein PHG01_00188 [Streptococcus mutans PKUSS-HG01]